MNTHMNVRCEICRDEGHFSLPQISTMGWKRNCNGIPMPHTICNLFFSLAPSLFTSPLPLHLLVQWSAVFHTDLGRFRFSAVCLRIILYRYSQISFDRRMALDRDKARFVRSARWNAISSEYTDSLSESSSLPKSCVQRGNKNCPASKGKGERETFRLCARTKFHWNGMHIENAQFGSAKSTSRIFVDVGKNERILLGSVFAEMSLTRKGRTASFTARCFKVNTFFGQKQYKDT